MIPNPSQLIDVPAFARQWLITTPEGQAWLILRGLSPDDLVSQPPTESCGPDTPVPEVFIESPLSGSTQSGVLTVYGTADAPNFSHYIVDFGLGPDPLGWGSLQGITPVPVHNGPLGQMDLTPFGDGQMTVRLTVFDIDGHSAEVRVTFNVKGPTPEPEEPTPIPPPPTETPTPSVTDTPVPEPPTEEPTTEPPPTETPATEEPTPEE